ncbi:TauD/TfdA dioxygenase family protein [Nocardia takedensis]|uniref:TauD/TfdA dioxygenase family protein n=1 Tax=Nocardia takedensis TaxID=259390 RepID=UPI000315525D|nr:TauD/TfdA family dioxygenase [Nocardia takedensis]
MTLAQIETRADREAAAAKIYRHAGLTVDRLGEHIGARLGGVRLGGDLPAEQVEAIRLALAIHKVVVFTEQHHLDGGRGGKPAQYQEFTSTEFETLHPVVRVHPETGERALLLGHFAKSFPDLSSTEFHSLFQLLQARITRLENTFRWHWRLGDVAIWDNRATQHYGIADYGDQERELHRITLAGDIPVNVDGSPSRPLTGDASHYSEVTPAKRLDFFA